VARVVELEEAAKEGRVEVARAGWGGGMVEEHQQQPDCST
jgi:hypothetical protein